MKRFMFFQVLVTAFVLTCNAQEKVFSYPFEFNESFILQKGFDINFSGDKTSTKIALVLHDDKRAAYVLADKDLKLQSDFIRPVNETLFSFDEEYLGTAIGLNDLYYFVYKISGTKLRSFYPYYQVEIVDFKNKTITNKHLFDIPKQEKILLSFSDYGEFYAITTDDKNNLLHIYNLKNTGEIFKKDILIKIPQNASKFRNQLSEYLENIRLVKDDEEAGMETVTQVSKIYSFKNKFTLLINDGEAATHLINIDKENYVADEKFITHSPFTDKSDRIKCYINSFLYENKLFSLGLNRKNIRIAINDVNNNKLLQNIEINDSTTFDIFAEPPVYEERRGKRETYKKITSIKKLIGDLVTGTEGLSVTQNREGKYIIKVGTYDPILYGEGYIGGLTVNQTRKMPTLFGKSVTVPIAGYLPGNPTHFTSRANYYTSTFFKISLATVSFDISKETVQPSTVEQIKEYIAGFNKKIKAAKQFAISDKQYYGYYDRDLKTYTIENIAIRK